MIITLHIASLQVQKCFKWRKRFVDSKAFTLFLLNACRIPCPGVPGAGDILFSWVLLMGLRRVVGDISAPEFPFRLSVPGFGWMPNTGANPGAYPGAGFLIHTLYIYVYNHSLHILASWQASKQRKTPVSHVPIIINSSAKSKQIFSIRPEFRNFLEQNKLYL